MTAPILDAFVAAGLLGLLVAAALAVRKQTWHPTRLEAFLQSRWAPAVAGVLTFLIVRTVWRSFGEPGVIHDERATLLQAEIFARGRWTAPSPPIAAFFEQMHVFVEPAVFAKYPPGHALMLVPGIWLGLPGLMPAALAGLAGGMTFWLARRLSNVWTAALTWMLWTTAPVTLLWATSYMSESTSTVMWLAAACATALWLESGKPRHLVCVAAALACGFAARPLTMLALGVPLGVVIGRRIVKTRQWRALAWPVLAGALLLGLGPLWNHQTLHDWRVDPYPQYSKTYFPFDKPGFGIDPSPPLRPLPPELSAMDAWSREVHEPYVPSAVPAALTTRVLAVLFAYGQGWRLAIAALLLASLIRPEAPARMCIAASVSLFVAYLAFAHPSGWIVYYFELLPGLHFLAAGYLVRLLGRLHAAPAALSARAAVVAALLMLPLCLGDLARVRTAIDRRNAFHREAVRAIARAPAHSVLFVRYPASHNPHLAVTRNEPDLASARAWVVYDRGADNARLMSLAPDRPAYVLDAATWRLEPLAFTRD